MASLLNYGKDDFLIADAKGLRVEHITVTPDADDALKRGTVLANDGDGTYSVLANTEMGSSSMSVSSHVLTIEAQNVVPSAIVAKSSGTALAEGTDYTVSVDGATGYTKLTLVSTSSYYSAESLDVAYATTNAGDAEVILAEEVPAGNSDTLAAAYVAGGFIEQGLTVGTALTDAARLNLKRAGIYLTNGITA